MEFTLAEAAQILGEKKPTVWSRISRGVVKISSAMQHGKKTILNENDLLAMAVAKRLSSLGSPMCASAEVMEYVKKRDFGRLSKQNWPTIISLSIRADGCWRADIHGSLPAPDNAKDEKGRVKVPARLMDQLEGGVSCVVLRLDLIAKDLAERIKNVYLIRNHYLLEKFGRDAPPPINAPARAA